MYTLYTNGVLEKDGFYVPHGSEEYEEYLSWIALGNTPTIADGRIYLSKTTQANTTKAQLRSEYLLTLETMQQISTAQTLTNAQLVSAIKFIAKSMRLLLIFLARNHL